jgi:hypothetical protein
MKEHKLRVYVSRVLRVICGFKKEEANGENVSVQAMEAKIGGGGK